VTVARIDNGGVDTTAVLLRVAIGILAASLVGCAPATVVPPASTAPNLTQATNSAPHASTTPSPTSLAEGYLRPLDGVAYSTMAPQTEQQVAQLFTDLPDGYAIRDVSVRGSTARLRLVVLHISDKYVGTKLLDDQTGFGGRTAAPVRLAIAGVPAFYHSDVTPNLLVWQQARFLVLIYGTDRPVMETLAAQLIVANR
jgi:hypothetical protein